MIKIYLICEVGWEYNDETYYRPESEGVTPKNAYNTKEEAVTACFKLNKEAFIEMDSNFRGFRSMGYDAEDLTSLPKSEVEELLKGICTLEELYNDEVNLSELDDQQLQKVMQVCDQINFYEVVEVPVK